MWVQRADVAQWQRRSRLYSCFLGCRAAKPWAMCSLLATAIVLFGDDLLAQLGMTGRSIESGWTPATVPLGLLAVATVVGAVSGVDARMVKFRVQRGKLYLEGSRLRPYRASFRLDQIHDVAIRANRAQQCFGIADVTILLGPREASIALVGLPRSVAHAVVEALS